MGKHEATQPVVEQEGAEAVPRPIEERATLIPEDAPDRAMSDLSTRAHDLGEDLRSEGDAVTAEAVQASVPIEQTEQVALDRVRQESLQRERELLHRLDEAKRLVQEKKAEARKLKVSSIFSSKRRFEKTVVEDELAEAQQQYDQALAEYRAADDGEAGARAVAIHDLRQELAQAEQKTKGGGLKGLVKRFTESRWQREQHQGEIDDLREQYDVERAELVADSVQAAIEEQSRMADARAIENYENMHWLYKMNRTLGEVNLAEEAGWKPTSKFGKIVASQFSVQKIIKMGLLGVSTGIAMSGVGMFPLSAMVIGRRLATGAAMGASRYERRAKKEMDKIQAEISKKDIAEMTTEELTEGINDMAAWAEINGVMISAHPAYQALQMERGRRMSAEAQERVEQRGLDMSAALSEMLAEADAGIAASRQQAAEKDALLQRENIALGAFFASGLYAEGIKQVMKGASFAVTELGIDQLAGDVLSKAIGIFVGEANAAETVADNAQLAEAGEISYTPEQPVIDDVAADTVPHPDLPEQPAPLDDLLDEQEKPEPVITHEATPSEPIIPKPRVEAVVAPTMEQPSVVSIPEETFDQDGVADLSDNEVDSTAEPESMPTPEPPHELPTELAPDASELPSVISADTQLTPEQIHQIANSDELTFSSGGLTYHFESSGSDSFKLGVEGHQSGVNTDEILDAIGKKRALAIMERNTNLPPDMARTAFDMDLQNIYRMHNLAHEMESAGLAGTPQFAELNSTLQSQVAIFQMEFGKVLDPDTFKIPEVGELPEMEELSEITEQPLGEVEKLVPTPIEQPVPIEQEVPTVQVPEEVHVPEEVPTPIEQPVPIEQEVPTVHVPEPPPQELAGELGAAEGAAEFAIEDSSQGFEYLVTPEAATLLDQMNIEMSDGIMHFDGQPMMHFVHGDDVSELMDSGVTQSVTITTEGNNLVVHVVDTDGTEVTISGANTQELYNSMIDNQHEQISAAASRLSQEAERAVAAISSGEMNQAEIGQLMDDLREVRQIAINYDDVDGLRSTTESLGMLDQAVQESAGTPEVPAELPDPAAPAEVTDISPEIMAGLEGQAGNALHNVNRALDQIAHGNLSAEDAFAVAEKYAVVATHIDEVGAAELADKVWGPIAELNAQATEAMAEDTHEAAQQATEAIREMRTGAISEADARALVQQAQEAAALAQEHDLGAQASEATIAADELQSAIDEMHGDQQATGFYAAAAEKAAKKAARTPVTTPGEFLTQELPRGIRQIDDVLIDRPLDTLEYLGHKAAAGISEGGIHPDEVPLPESHPDTMPDYDPSKVPGERWDEFRAERAGARASELSELQAAEQAAAEAAQEQQEALEAPEVGADEVAAAQEALDSSGEMRTARAVVSFVEKRGGGFKVGEVAGDIPEFEATQRLLDPSYREIITGNQGVSMSEAQIFIDNVEANVNHLAHLREVRDAMLDQGLGQSPQMEALNDEIEDTLQHIHKYGHVLRDDPQLGKPGPGQGFRQVAGKLFQAGSGRAPR